MLQKSKQNQAFTQDCKSAILRKCCKNPNKIKLLRRIANLQSYVNATKIQAKSSPFIFADLRKIYVTPLIFANLCKIYVTPFICADLRNKYVSPLFFAELYKTYVTTFIFADLSKKYVSPLLSSPTSAKYMSLSSPTSAKYMPLLSVPMSAKYMSPLVKTDITLDHSQKAEKVSPNKSLHQIRTVVHNHP